MTIVGDIEAAYEKAERLAAGLGAAAAPPAAAPVDPAAADDGESTPGGGAWGAVYYIYAALIYMCVWASRYFRPQPQP